MQHMQCPHSTIRTIRTIRKNIANHKYGVILQHVRQEKHNRLRDSVTDIADNARRFVTAVAYTKSNARDSVTAYF